MPTFRITSPDGKTYDVTGPEGSTAEEALARVRAQHEPVAAKSPAPTPVEPESTRQRTADQAGGFLRGAGRIGSTLLELGRSGPMGEPFGTLLDRIKSRNADIEGGTQSLGANPAAGNYKGGDIVAQILGTAGAGGALGGVAKGFPAAAKLAPALESGGFSTGLSGLPNAAARVAGGALTGGAMTGLVDPEHAVKGAMIGGALPLVTQAVGTIGRGIGNKLGAPAQTAEQTAAIQQARDAGYVIPPSQARPTLTNRLLEGFSGKITTAQNASARNQAVTNKLAAESIGLPADAPLTPDLLKSVRDEAGKAYEAIGSAGVIHPGEKYAEALDRIAIPHLQASVGFPSAKVSPVVEMVNSLRSEAFDASSAVAKIKELRSAADDAFRTGNTDMGRASKAAASALESAIEEHLAKTNANELLAQFRDARTLIAKTYSVEKAMNPATGSVDARKLAAQLAKKKPLSGGLLDAATFAGRFPKAAQPIEGMGSLPQTSPLDWWAAGGASMATGNPLPMMGVMARPAARSFVLSPMVQNRLAQQPQGGGLLSNDAIYRSLLRSAPLLGADQ